MAAVNKQKKVELAPLPNALLAGGAKLELPVKYQSHSVEKLFKLAERFFRNGKFEKAQDLYAEIIGRKGEKETDSLLVHSLIGLCKTQLQLGITERAFENLQKAEFKSSQLKESSLLEAEIILITITAHIKLGLYPDERIKSRLPFSFMAKENEFDFSKHALHFLRKAKEIFTNSGNCTEERKEQIIKLELQTHVLTSSDKISELALKIFYDKSLSNSLRMQAADVYIAKAISDSDFKAALSLRKELLKDPSREGWSIEDDLRRNQYTFLKIRTKFFEANPELLDADKVNELRGIILSLDKRLPEVKTQESADLLIDIQVVKLYFHLVSYKEKFTEVLEDTQNLLLNMPDLQTYGSPEKILGLCTITGMFLTSLENGEDALFFLNKAIDFGSKIDIDLVKSYPELFYERIKAFELLGLFKEANQERIHFIKSVAGLSRTDKFSVDAFLSVKDFHPKLKKLTEKILFEIAAIQVEEAVEVKQQSDIDSQNLSSNKDFFKADNALSELIQFLEANGNLSGENGVKSFFLKAELYSCYGREEVSIHLMLELLKVTMKLDRMPAKDKLDVLEDILSNFLEYGYSDNFETFAFSIQAHLNSILVKAENLSKNVSKHQQYSSDDKKYLAAYLKFARDILKNGQEQTTFSKDFKRNLEDIISKCRIALGQRSPKKNELRAASKEILLTKTEKRKVKFISDKEHEALIKADIYFEQKDFSMATELYDTFIIDFNEKLSRVKTFNELERILFDCYDVIKDVNLKLVECYAEFGDIKSKTEYLIDSLRIHPTLDSALDKNHLEKALSIFKGLIFIQEIENAMKLLPVLRSRPNLTIEEQTLFKAADIFIKSYNSDMSASNEFIDKLYNYTLENLSNFDKDSLLFFVGFLKKHFLNIPDLKKVRILSSIYLENTEKDEQALSFMFDSAMDLIFLRTFNDAFSLLAEAKSYLNEKAEIDPLIKSKSRSQAQLITQLAKLDKDAKVLDSAGFFDLSRQIGSSYQGSSLDMPLKLEIIRALQYANRGNYNLSLQCFRNLINQLSNQEDENWLLIVYCYLHCAEIAAKSENLDLFSKYLKVLEPVFIEASIFAENSCIILDDEASKLIEDFFGKDENNIPQIAYNLEDVTSTLNFGFLCKYLFLINKYIESTLDLKGDVEVTKVSFKIKSESKAKSFPVTALQFASLYANLVNSAIVTCESQGLTELQAYLTIVQANISLWSGAKSEQIEKSSRDLKSIIKKIERQRGSTNLLLELYQTAARYELLLKRTNVATNFLHSASRIIKKEPELPNAETEVNDRTKLGEKLKLTRLFVRFFEVKTDLKPNEKSAHKKLARFTKLRDSLKKELDGQNQDLFSVS